MMIVDLVKFVTKQTLLSFVPKNQLNAMDTEGRGKLLLLVHLNHQWSARLREDIVETQLSVQELFMTTCVQEDRITSVALTCHSRRMSVQAREECVETVVGVGWRIFCMDTVPINLTPSSVVFNPQQRK